jgi:HSP20 family protein
MDLMHFPKVDVKENASEVFVVAHLSGVNPKKVNVEVGESMVKMSGESVQERETNEAGVHRIETTTFTFQKVVALPCPVKTEGVKAFMKDGHLTVILQKKQAAEPFKMKKIPVEDQ